MMHMLLFGNIRPASSVARTPHFPGVPLSSHVLKRTILHARQAVAQFVTFPREFLAPDLQ
jgi:hypothetical protein